MNASLSRRLLIQRGMLLGASSMMLAGCGDGSATASAPAIGSAGPQGQPVAPAPGVSVFKWKPLRIGAGGYVTGLDIAKDGTKIVRADSAGAFVWSDAGKQWQPLLTMATMPKGEWGHEVQLSTGIYEAIVAPSNSQRIYVAFNGYVFRSDNRGQSFTKTGLKKISMSGNDDFRMFGKKMAVDPVNPNVVVIGSQTDGVFITTDGGSTWRQVTDVPAAATNAGMRVAFDPSSSSGGTTKTLYVSSQGNGVYVSTDAGGSFEATSGGPTSALHMVCDSGGTLWLTENVQAANLRRFANGRWTSTGPNSRMKTIAIDPGSAGHIVVATEGGSIAQSFDGGVTWTDVYNIGYPKGAGDRVADDIPWLAWTNENYMSSGEMQFDPSASNKLYFAEGIGVWWANTPNTFTGFEWHSQSIGIEQLVSNQFLSPPGGKPIYLAWDRPLFRIENPDAAPKTHGPNNKNPIVMGWSGDYAPNNPKRIVALVNNWGVDESSVSSDGGLTWTKFGSTPPSIANAKIGGSIAAGGENNFVWLPNNNGQPWYTLDGGNSWQASTVPNVPTTGTTGWGYAYFLHRIVVVADKVKIGVFYMYNLGGATGLYRSIDGGVTFSKVFSGEIAGWSGYNAVLSAVPGQQGHLFFTSGIQDGSTPSDSKLMRSTDGGSSWSGVADMQEVHALGFGASAAGQSYPAIYVAGYYKGQFGIWRSDNNAQDWTSLGVNPLDIGDEIKAISGDMNTYGTVYVGFGGSGAVYGSLTTS
jgi:photosystem II stability/assembly factor-like uncharacterized protein